MLLDNRLYLTCSSKFFQGASYAAVAVVTIGSNLEDESSKMFRNGEFIEALTMDACGIAVLNEVTGYIRQKLADWGESQGWELGYTLNPGCHMIPLEQQKVVFSLVEADRIGVKLTESYLMVPIKSSSLIIPVGKGLDLPNQSNNACELCNRQTTCLYKPYLKKNGN